jgi:hypothetical protein
MYKCQWCNKKFHLENGLLQHLNAKTDEKHSSYEKKIFKWVDKKDEKHFENCSVPSPRELLKDIKEKQIRIKRRLGLYDKKDGQRWELEELNRKERVILGVIEQSKDDIWKKFENKNPQIKYAEKLPIKPKENFECAPSLGPACPPPLINKAKKNKLLNMATG